MNTHTSTDLSSEQANASVRFRRFIYRWLFDPNQPGNYQKSVETWISLLIVANLVALLAENIDVVYAPNKALFHAFDVFSLVVFTIEYVLRFYAAPEDDEFKHSGRPRWAFVRSPFALIDLAAILPFYLQFVGVTMDLRVLRALRLLRLLKLLRVLVPAVQEFRALNRGKTFRQQMYALFYETETSGQLHQLVDTFVVWWVLISVLAVVLESVESVHYHLNVEFIVLDAVAVAVFSIEYLCRVYSCVENPEYKNAVSGRIRYAKTPLATIDFLAIVPFYLEALLHHLFDLRFLRIFRLMRLLKLTRYTSATGTLLKALQREWPVIAASTFIMLLMVVLTASLGYLFEHEAQPDKFENIPQAIYWAVVTLASVGYGDISPVTPVGRLMTIIMALVGIGIFAVPAAILSTAFNDQLHKEREAMASELRRFMADGFLDEQERAQIFEEAKRLHISEREVENLIEKVQFERQRAEGAQLPLKQMAENPEVAFEHFRSSIGQLRQIIAAGNQEKVSQLFEQAGRATDAEKAIWRQLTAR